MRLVLVGFMASGKTTVGRLLAERLDLDFIDLDDEIEALAQSSVAEIFRRDGESRFRDLEHEALARIINRPGVVIATGGGTICFERNRELIESASTSIWLHPPFSTLARRLSQQSRDACQSTRSGEVVADARPLAGPVDDMEALYSSRLSAYQGADVVLVVEAEELPGQTVEALIERLRERE